jgi:hypothetical protein
MALSKPVPPGFLENLWAPLVNPEPVPAAEATEEFWKALMSGQWDILTRLVANGLSPDVSPLSNPGLRPLVWAVRNGNEEAVRQLLALGADPVMPTKRLLETGLGDGNIGIVDLLVQAGVPFPEKDDDLRLALSTNPESLLWGVRHGYALAWVFGGENNTANGEDLPLWASRTLDRIARRFPEGSLGTATLLLDLVEESVPDWSQTRTGTMHLVNLWAAAIGEDRPDLLAFLAGRGLYLNPTQAKGPDLIGPVLGYLDNHTRTRGVQTLRAFEHVLSMPGFVTRFVTQKSWWDKVPVANVPVMDLLEKAGVPLFEPRASRNLFLHHKERVIRDGLGGRLVEWLVKKGQVGLLTTPDARGNAVFSHPRHIQELEERVLNEVPAVQATPSTRKVRL